MNKKLKIYLQELYKNKRRFATIILVLLSQICFFAMLIGGANGSVDLNKFTFDESISAILQRKSIKFTLVGYCIDNKCKKDVSNNFDKGKKSHLY